MIKEERDVIYNIEGKESFFIIARRMIKRILPEGFIATSPETIKYPFMKEDMTLYDTLLENNGNSFLNKNDEIIFCIFNNKEKEKRDKFFKELKKLIEKYS